MRPRILHIEDNDAFANDCARVWTAAGFSYRRYAQAPLPLVDEVLANEADIIVTDFNLPGMDGMSILRLLANDERTSAIPRMLYTSLENSGIAHQAARYGGRYACKLHVAPTELIPMLRSLLDESDAPAGTERV